MSLHQANPAVARSRSLRVPAKTALTAPPLASTTITSAQIPTSSSNIALFLTNLRLLDLDHEPDWPGITLATFSTKDAAGGQKKRIQCVEWALYQLFTLWDYDDTQNVGIIGVLRALYGYTNVCTVEITTVLPTPRSGPVNQPPSRSPPRP